MKIFIVTANGSPVKVFATAAQAEAFRGKQCDGTPPLGWIDWRVRALDVEGGVSEESRQRAPGYPT